MRLIHRPIERVPINGRCARVHPDPGWVSGFRDSFADKSGGLYTRALDRQTIGLVIAAIDIASGKIDDHVRAVQAGDPRPSLVSRPMDGLPRRRLRITRKNGDIVTVPVKMPGDYDTDLAATARNHDAQRIRGQASM